MTPKRSLWQFWVLGSLLTLGSTLLIPTRGLSQSRIEAPRQSLTPDLLCYIEWSGGRVLDLQQLCGSSYKRSALSSLDLRFLDRYESRLQKRLEFLKQRSGLSSSAKQLLHELDQSPRIMVERAKSTCSAIAAGTLPQNGPSGSGLDGDIVKKLALKHYCPELDD